MTLLLFYTDPGSGIMLLQILLAFFASGVFYFRKYFYKFFGKERSAEKLGALTDNSQNAAVGDGKEV
jgi:hypothetical protein